MEIAEKLECIIVGLYQKSARYCRVGGTLALDSPPSDSDPSEKNLLRHKTDSSSSVPDTSKGVESGGHGGIQMHQGSANKRKILCLADSIFNFLLV